MLPAYRVYKYSRKPLGIAALEIGFATQPNYRWSSTRSQRYASPENALSSLRQDVWMVKSASGDMLRRKWTDAYSFYEQFSHMDEVREAQDKVVFVQNELQAVQQTRSDRMHELINVRERLQPLRNDLSKVSMMDGERYLRLCEQIVELQREEQSLLEKFQQEEQKERNIFTHLTTAVKASHEKEKVYANTVKYWSYIGSILGVVLGIAGSTLSYQYRQNTYKTLTDNYTEQVTIIRNNIDDLKQELTELKHEIKVDRLNSQRQLEQVQKIKKLATNQESWGGFLYRKSVDFIWYFVPRSKDLGFVATNIETIRR